MPRGRRPFSATASPEQRVAVARVASARSRSREAGRELEEAIVDALDLAVPVRAFAPNVGMPAATLHDRYAGVTAAMLPLPAAQEAIA
jgi:hypothetical protein